MTEINGTVYKITSPTGKVYIGQTIQPVEIRWGHYKRMDCKTQTRLYNSFKKHGVENHIFEVVMTGITSKEMLDWYEIFYIAVYDATGENGLNCTIGGEGRYIPEEDLKYGMRPSDERYNTVQNKAWREANREKVKARQKAWKERNPEKVKAINKAAHKTYKEKYPERVKATQKASDKAYRERHPERVKAMDKAHHKAYYEGHKDEILAKQKAYHEVNKEKISVRRKTHYEAHKEEILTQQKAYREAHKEEIKVKNKAKDVREKEIHKFYGYTRKEWRALPADMRAQMRAQYDALQGGSK